MLKLIMPLSISLKYIRQDIILLSLVAPIFKIKYILPRENFSVYKVFSHMLSFESLKKCGLDGLSVPPSLKLLFVWGSILLKDADWKVVSTNKNNITNRPQAAKRRANVLRKVLHLERALFRVTMWYTVFLFKGSETHHLGVPKGGTVCQCPGSVGS